MIQPAFEGLLEKIGVSQAQRSQGSTSHTYVRGLLDNKWKTDPTFPWLATGDFLSGSYARGTKIHPLDDIDVMIVLDGSGLFQVEGGRQTNAIVRGEAHGSPVHTLTYGTQGLISSKRILEKFRDALQEAYPSSDIRKNGQAVNVWLESYGLGLDIVPSFHIIPQDGRRDFYYIPKGGESHEWMSTNPKIDAEIYHDLDTRHDGKLKPVVKLLKHWNEVYNNSRLQSYHLETVAMYVFDQHPDQLRDHASALTYFFNNAEPYLVQNCDDMTRIGGHVDTYLTPEARGITLERIRQTCDIIRTHYPLGSLVVAGTALTGWRKIFGDSFGA